MEANEFDSRLRELEVMIGKYEAVTLFNHEYEALLTIVRQLPLPRSGKLAKMQRLVERQRVFLMNTWMQENKKAGMN